MVNKKLQAALNKVNKQAGKEVAFIAGKDPERLKIKFYPTSSNDVNEMLVNGIARGRIIELAGNPSSGKTSFALELIAHNQKKAKEEALAKGEKDYDFTVGWFETEESFDSEYAEMLGVDLSDDKFIYWDQRDVSAEEGFDILNSFVASGAFRMIIVNSVSGLIPSVEMNDVMGSNNIALTARLLSKEFRMVTGSAAKNDCTLIFINQLRATMSKYSPTDSSGGNALKYYSSQRISMSKVKVGKDDPITADEGVKVNCSVLKNRCANATNPYRRCSYYARYGKGIDNYVTLPEMLIRAEVVKQAGAWFRIENESGDIETIAGELCKWQGKNKMIDAFMSNPELLEELEYRLACKYSSTGVSLSDEEINEIKMEEVATDREFSD